MFNNFNKAFDSLFHDKIWLTLSQKGVSIKFIKILNNLYENFWARIKLYYKKSDKFSIKQVVIQGDLLYVPEYIQFSPRTHFSVKDQNLADFKHLAKLRFMDDIVIITKSGEELKSMGEDLRKENKNLVEQ